MVPRSKDVRPFPERLRDSVRTQSLRSFSLPIPRNHNVYTCGDRDNNLYLIEHGQIKLSSPTSNGKNCLLAIYSTPDVFGEHCLMSEGRLETATAMMDTTLKQIRSDDFMAGLAQHGLLEEFIRYLISRVAEQQTTIKHFLTADSERRLAVALLQLGCKLGTNGPQNQHIANRVSHQELAEMVGTTRSRVGWFLQRFQALGLIERTRHSRLIIKAAKLLAYLEEREKPACSRAGASEN
jgi:CRP-like cAMP-binding protein